MVRRRINIKHKEIPSPNQRIMAEGPSSTQPTAANADGGNQTTQGNNDEGKQGSRRNRQRQNKPKWKDGSSNNTTGHIQKEKFAGRSEDLKGFIYDVALSKGGAVYTKTTKEIARHVGEKYTTIGSYIRTAMLTLTVPTPPRPIAPIATGDPAVINLPGEDLDVRKN
jgi:hypothetical protein